MMDDKADILLDTIAQAIFDKKGANILVLDVSRISTMTHYFVIAEGTSTRHVVALSNNVSNALVEQGVPLLHVDGKQNGDWVVLDYDSVVVHFFLPELRERYNLEGLWREGKVVDVNIKI